MIQQLRQQSLHPTNLWGKQKRPPLVCNPFEKHVPFWAHQFKNKLNKGHGNELAQWNVHSWFSLGIDIEFLQDLIGCWICSCSRSLGLHFHMMLESAAQTIYEMEKLDLQWKLMCCNFSIENWIIMYYSPVDWWHMGNIKN